MRCPECGTEINRKAVDPECSKCGLKLGVFPEHPKEFDSAYSRSGRTTHVFHKGKWEELTLARDFLAFTLPDGV
jgi:NMD protein affecting ribosome stability and mRNA decay